MAETLIQTVTDYMLSCPLIEDGVLRVDALGLNDIEYTIETGMFEPIVDRFVDGSTRRQYQFSIGSREFYSMDRIQNIENSGFYERLAEWIELQNKIGNFPNMPDGMYPEEIRVMATGYIFDLSMQNARYQMPLQLIYIKEV